VKYTLRTLLNVICVRRTRHANVSYRVESEYVSSDLAVIRCNSNYNNNNNNNSGIIYRSNVFYTCIPLFRRLSLTTQ